MFEDVEIKRKKKNKILFSRKSECLQELLALIRLQKHRTLVLWAFKCIEDSLMILENSHDKKILATAFSLCQKWAKGEVKMAVAKQAILDCHQLCKELDDDYYIALYHAIGQGLSTVHVETHAIGLPIYELTAIVLQNKENYQDKVKEKIKYYIDMLIYFQNNIDYIDYQWADFLKKRKSLIKKKYYGKKEKLRIIMKSYMI